MQDTIEVKLPSGKVVVLRNYTTRADDLAYDSVMFGGVSTDSTGDYNIPLLNTSAADSTYVYRLVKSIDNQTEGLGQAIDDLRTTDYKVLSDSVAEIVKIHSPKAQEAGNASATK